MRRSTLQLAAALFLAVCPPLLAQRAPFPIPDPDPEIERKSFQLAEGFEVNLFAADPLLAKPIQMNFDPAGRLWVVSSEVYPQIQPGQTADDKVLILEDTDGDGKADRTGVFARGLLIPTGVEPGDGGAYVANSTELLHFKDTDGDGKADRTRVVLSGFGTEDTHHILHTLRWGYDGTLYFNQSIYIHSHVETPHGVRRLGGGGVWQFRPETMRLEVFIRGLINPWGHHFDRWGQSFVTDGAGFEGIQYALPGAYYMTAPDAVRILHGLNPGSPKYCGAEILSGRHLPDDWAGTLLTNDFRGNRVCRFVLSDDGAGYAARLQNDLIRTSHVAFRPIDVKLGPDGAIYIADWYNPIIQHGEVDFRDPRRDHTRGRIWRVTAKGRPLVPRPKLVEAKTEALLDALRAPEDWTRHQAKRVLKERGAAAVVGPLAAWVKNVDPAAPDAEHRKLEGLWTYQSLDVVEPDLLAGLLRARDPRVRAAATRVVAHWHDRLSDPLALLAERVIDDHPRVRLEAVRALAELPQARSAELAMQALDRPVDQFLDYALWLTARQLQGAWLPELLAGRLDFGGDGRKLVFALQAVGSPAVVRPLVEAIRAGRVPTEHVEGALATIAALGQPSELTMVYNAATRGDETPPARRLALLSALLKAAEQRGVRPEGDLSAGLSRWLDGDDEALRADAARAVGLWKVEALAPRLEALGGASEVPDAIRQAAIDGLGRLGPAGRQAVERLAGERSPPRARALALATLASIDAKAAAAKVVNLLPSLQDASEVGIIVSRFVKTRNGPAALSEALASRSLPPDVAKLALRASRASGREEPALIAALTRAGGLADSSRPPSPEEVSQIVADVAKLGNPARGEEVFRRKEQSCLKCHAISGAGGQVGPGLESIGASAPVDYLVDSLLQPNKAVKENYHATVIATTDGRVISGIKLRQTNSEIVLRDADDREVVIPVSAVEEQKPGGSLMPAGLTDSLTRGELLDLVRFLSELGKVGAYSPGKAQFLRKWEALEPTPEVWGRLHSNVGMVVDPQAKLSWSPAYSKVSGTLPLDALPRIAPGGGRPALGVARGQIDVTTGGPVRLALHPTAGLTAWVDGRRVEHPEALTLDLTAGRHMITLAVDLDRVREGIQCQLEDVPGSPAKAQMVVGK